jgi:hypothetical protein
MGLSWRAAAVRRIAAAVPGRAAAISGAVVPARIGADGWGVCSHANPHDDGRQQAHQPDCA